MDTFYLEMQSHATAIYRAMTLVALPLIMIGLMARLGTGNGDPSTIIWSVFSVFMVALAIGAFPDWGNRIQDTAKLIVEEVGANPSEVHKEFSALIVGTTEGEENRKVGIWDILWAKEGGIGHAMVYATIFLTGKLSLVIMFIYSVVQKLLVLFQIGLAPAFIAMLMIGPLKGIGTQFILKFVSVLLWPLGWALSHTLTKALLKLAADNQVYEITNGVVVSFGPQTGFFSLTISLWMTLSTIAAPLIISKLMITGANAGSALLSAVGGAVAQAGFYGVSGGATAALAGASPAGAAATGIAAGTGGAVSGALGQSGGAIPAAIGVGATLAMVQASGGAGEDYNTQAANIAQKNQS